MAPQPNFFQKLKIVHLALLVGFFLFTLFTFTIRETGYFTNRAADLDRTLQVVTVVVSAACLLIGFNLFKKRILVARQLTEPAEARFRLYLSACLTWWAMIELPGFLAIIGFLLTGNYAFFALAIFHLLLLLLFMPRKANIILLLQLSEEEVERLSGNDNL